MKLFATILTSLFICAGYGQVIKDHPKFFTMHNAKLSLGASIESSLSTALMIDKSSPSDLKVIYKDPRDGKTTSPFVSYGFALDVYSANSVLGFLSGLDFTNYSFGVENQSQNVEYFTASRIEIPFFLKFRPGIVDGTSHFWLLLGGSYNFPTSCKREAFNLSDQSSVSEDDKKQQLSSNFSVSGSIGYEFFSQEHQNFRIAVYSRISYPLSSDINKTYPDFQASTGTSIVSSYPDADIRAYRITLGLKLMFRFGEAVAIMADAAKKY